MRNGAAIFANIFSIVVFALMASAQSGPVPAAKLMVEIIDGTKVRLEWPQTSSDFVLEEADALTNISMWLPVTQRLSRE